MRRLQLLILTISITVVIAGCSRQENEIKIPFTYDEHVYVEVTLGDAIKGRFILDTGTSGLYLDSTFVASSSFFPAHLEEANIGKAGNEKTILIITDPLDFTLGNTTFHSAQTPILNLRDFDDKGIAGIMGINFLKNFIVNINFEEKYLVLHTPDFRPKLVQLNHLNYKLVNDRIITEALVTLDSENVIKGEFEVDFDCTDDIRLTYQTARAHGLYGYENKVAYGISPLGLGIVKKVGYELRASSIIFGENSLRKVIVSYPNDTMNAWSENGALGWIGVPLFSRYNFYIDFPEDRIFFRPFADARKKFQSSITGFDVARTTVNGRQVLVVNKLFKPSLAASYGLQLGDTIIIINGQKIEHISQPNLEQIMTTEGVDLEFQYKRAGKLHQIKFVTEDVI